MGPLTATPSPVCQGANTTLSVTGLTDMAIGPYGIQFKYFAAPTATPYTGGTTIATVPNGSLGGGGTTASTITSFATAGTYYIYSVLSPIPADVTCRPSATVTLTVNPIPLAPIATLETSGTTNNDGIICTGASVTLRAPGGASSYQWTGGPAAQDYIVTPAGPSNTYSVLLSNSLGCFNTITTTITVNPLPTTFTITGGGQYCNNPGAIPNAVGLSGSQTGVNYQLLVNASPTGAPVAGTGSAITFGPQGTAGTYTVVATNITTGCTQTMTGSVTVSAITCTPSITDPCTCLNNATTLTNGQFGETIVVNAPAGQTWTVTVVSGLFTTGSPAPPAAPTPILVGATMTEGPATVYTLMGRHVDAIGYSISVNNGLGTTLMITNNCTYPNPVITGLAATYCANDAAVTLTGTPGDANIVSQSFTVNGNPATQFNPAALGAGMHTVVYTVDGGVAKAFGPADPGCVQSVSQVVTVNPVPVVTTAATATICSGATTNILLTSDIPGSTFIWTIVAGTGTVTGATACAAACGTTIAQMLTNTSNTTPATIIYRVVPTSPLGCVGLPYDITVTVNPAPVVTTAPSKTICNNTNTNIALTASTPPVNTFTWVIGTITGGVTGASAGAGSTISQVLM